MRVAEAVKKLTERSGGLFTPMLPVPVRGAPKSSAGKTTWTHDIGGSTSRTNLNHPGQSFSHPKSSTGHLAKEAKANTAGVVGHNGHSVRGVTS